MPERSRWATGAPESPTVSPEYFKEPFNRGMSPPSTRKELQAWRKKERGHFLKSHPWKVPSMSPGPGEMQKKASEVQGQRVDTRK